MGWLIVAWIGMGAVLLLVAPWRVNVKVAVDLAERKLGLAVGLWRGTPLTVWIDLRKAVVRTARGAKPLELDKVHPKEWASSRPLRLAKRILKRTDLRAEVNVVVGGDPFLASLVVGALQALTSPWLSVRAYPMGETVKGNGRMRLTFCLLDLVLGLHRSVYGRRFVAKNDDRLARFGGRRYDHRAYVGHPRR